MYKNKNQILYKVVYKKKKNSVMQYACELDAVLCKQQALVKIVHPDFIQHAPDKSFLVDNFAYFLGVG